MGPGGTRWPVSSWPTRTLSAVLLAARNLGRRQRREAEGTGLMRVTCGPGGWSRSW
jgi:hypothetical protein